MIPEVKEIENDAIGDLKSSRSDQDDAGDGQQERVLVVWARAALTKQGIGGL